MALLTLSEAKQKIEKPSNSDSISRAKRLEERIKLHVEAVMDQDELQSRFNFFLKWVQGILPPDKVEGFKILWQAPNETNELAESIFGELFRVWTAENPYIKHRFKDSESEIEHLLFLDRVKDKQFWENEYWREIQADQNSFVVVDLPAQQITPRPEPYKYLLDIDSLIDADVNKDGEVEYLIFWCSDRAIAVLDDESWRKFEVPFDDKDVPDMSKAELKLVVNHTLKRVPAAPVLFDPISKRSNLVNHNPITKSLGAFDWLLFFEVAKKYLETYAPFPIYATYSELTDDDVVTQNKGEQVFEHGVSELIEPGARFIPNANADHANRNAANRKLTGPGTVQRYDAPKDANDSDLLANPVQVIPAEEVSLNYCDKYVNSLNSQIFTNCVGQGGEVVASQAVNEDQVQSVFESKVNILGKLRKKIETCRRYIYAVEAELRYGTLYISTDVSMGDRYYLTSVKEQQDELKASKESGMPQFEIDNQIQSIYKNKYRDQPEILSRNQILSQIEPYPGLTLDQAMNLLSKGLAAKEKVKIKAEFDALIKRFEREQMNVVEFASARPLQTKIDIIFTKLLEYVKQDEQNYPSEPVQGPTPPGGGKPGEGPLPPVS